MVKPINGWKIDWKKGSGDKEAIRYYKYHPNAGADNIQIAKYRDADDFDKHMGNKYDWHGKWYVQTWSPEKTKLFKKKSDAKKFLKKYMEKH